MSKHSLVLVLAMPALVACSSGVSLGTTGASSGTGSRRTNAAAGASSGNSSGASSGNGTTGGATTSGGSGRTTTSSGSGATSTSGSSSGSSGITCPGIETHPLNDCQGDLIEVAGELFDFCNEDSLLLLPADTITDAFNTTITASFLSTCGIFYFCLAPGTVITPLITINGEITTLLPPIVATQNTSYAYDPGIYMVCDMYANNLLPTELTNPAFNPDLGYVLVQASNDGATKTPDAGPAFAGTDGWQFHLEDDAGMPIDAPVAYFASDTVDPAATATDGEGVALIFNIPSGVSAARLVGVNPGASDAGFDVAYNGDWLYGQSLVLPISAHDITFFPYFYP
jgi:hypothetical protein